LLIPKTSSLEHWTPKSRALSTKLEPVSCRPVHAATSVCLDRVEFGDVRSLPNRQFPIDLLMFHPVGIIHEKSFLHSGNHAFHFVGIVLSPYDPASGE
jgi:hypothetical protein